MKCTCPACGAVYSLDVLLANDGARDAVMVALQLPAQLGKLLIQYVALFRPAERQLSFDRLANILGGLLPMIESGRVERSGRTWPAPLEYWRAALEDITSKRDKLTLPLKSHGYLLEIIAGLANKAEGAQEAKTEQGKLHTSQARGMSQPLAVGAVSLAGKQEVATPGRVEMPAGVRQQLKDFTGKETK